MCALGRQVDFPVLIRTVDTLCSTIRQAIDRGPCGLQDAIGRIRAAGERAGKTMWRIGHGPTMVREGFHFVCIGEPMAMLQRALADADRETRAARGSG